MGVTDYTGHGRKEVERRLFLAKDNKRRYLKRNRDTLRRAEAIKATMDRMKKKIKDLEKALEGL